MVEVYNNAYENISEIVDKIVKREVVRIITPGTVIDSSMLDGSTNTYIMSIYKSKNNVYGLCRNVAGYAEAIKEFDKFLPQIKKGLNNKTISYAYCFSIYHHMFAHFRSQTPWLIFAPSSLPNRPTSRKIITPNSITEIAKVLSDPTRITILQLLFSNDSMSIKDLLPYVASLGRSYRRAIVHREARR